MSVGATSGAAWVGRPAGEIAAAVRAGEATAVEVLDEHLTHIDRVEPRVGAFEVVDHEGARRAAEAVDADRDRRRLSLAGVPIGVKDVLDVTGLPTRHGSAGTTDAPARQDDEVVARVRAAGAVIVGKTRCPELCLAAASDNAFGVARNPWDLDRVSGGSSGGSAAALASGQVPLAIGSDGGGSIRLPSAACGTVGIKPGQGTVPRRSDHPAAHWCGMSEYGPMATTVVDLGLLLDVLADTERFAAAATGAGSTRLRVAVSQRPPLPGVSPTPAIVAVWREASDALREAGHTLTAADPEYPSFLGRAAAARSFQGTAHDVEQLGIDRARLGPRARTVLRLARWTSGPLPVDPGHVQSWTATAERFFADHDLLLTPATASTAFRHRDWHHKGFLRILPASIRFGAFTSPWNVGGLPAAAVPVGRTDDGLPICVQLVAGRGREDVVLAAAAQLQRRLPWPRHAPGWLDAAVTAGAAR